MTHLSAVRAWSRASFLALLCVCAVVLTPASRAVAGESAGLFPVVAMGANHSATIDSAGHLWAWGSNTYGQVGDGTTTDRLSPVRIGGAAAWVWVDVGAFHTIAIRQDGTVWAWGRNNRGQLGLGDNTDRHLPAAVPVTPANGNWNLVYAGDDFSAFTDLSGDLWTWGANDKGQLGLGDFLDRSSPTLASPDLGYVVSAGGRHMCAIVSGHLWAWGDNSKGQLGNGGGANLNAPTPIGLATDWESVSCGGAHTLATRNYSYLWAWGDNEYGQLGLGTTTDHNTPQPVSIAGSDLQNVWEGVSAGANHSLAYGLPGGQQALYSWGLNENGQLGLGDTTNRTSPVKINGTEPGDSAGLYGEAYWFDAGGDSSSIRKVFYEDVLGYPRTRAMHFSTWGKNTLGQLGDGTTTGRTIPTRLNPDLTLTGLTAPATASGTSVAVTWNESLGALRYEWRVGQGAWVSVGAAGSATVGGLVAGSNTISVRAMSELQTGTVQTVAVNATVVALPTVTLSAPKTSVASPRVRRAFTITGTLKPRFAAGTSPVKAYFYKRNAAGAYLLVKSVSMKASNYSTYSKLSTSTSLSSKGRYRVRLYFSGSAKSSAKKSYALTWGAYRYFTAK